MKKDLLVLLAILLLAALLLSGTEFQTVEEYYLTHIDDIKPDSKTVFLSIRCDTVLENTENLDPALRRGGTAAGERSDLSRNRVCFKRGRYSLWAS